MHEKETLAIIEEGSKVFEESEEDWSIYKDHEKRKIAFFAGAKWATERLVGNSREPTLTKEIS